MSKIKDIEVVLDNVDPEVFRNYAEIILGRFMVTANNSIHNAFYYGLSDKFLSSVRSDVVATIHLKDFTQEECNLLNVVYDVDLSWILDFKKKHPELFS